MAGQSLELGLRVWLGVQLGYSWKYTGAQRLSWRGKEGIGPDSWILATAAEQPQISLTKGLGGASS